jgi:hypothetical protein
MSGRDYTEPTWQDGQWIIGDPPAAYATRAAAIASRCPECGFHPRLAGGRCFDCRGRSMCAPITEYDRSDDPH